ncbi:GNAT family N-acetyltransferase [Planctomycetota bacterium]
MLKGSSVALTSVEREDLASLMAWRNNTEFRKHFREFRELNRAAQERWFETQVLGNPDVIMFAIRRLADGELLGCCGFVYINWIHRHADLSLYIGWEDAYIDDQGYGYDACDVLLRHGFNELGLNKVWTEIYSFDTKKHKLYDRFGFHLDGKLRQNYFYDGKYWDSLILSLLAEENKERIDNVV